MKPAPFHHQWQIQGQQNSFQPKPLHPELKIFFYIYIYIYKQEIFKIFKTVA